MNRIIAIGDIHGCYYTLTDLLRECKATKNDTYIFTGDYIDRGPFSCQVVQRLLDAQQRYGQKQVILLRGNHENFAIQSNGQLSMLWEANGGRATLESYAKYGGETFRNHVSAFKKMRLYYQTEHYIFCHAGLTHPKLKDNTEHDLLWGRDWIDEDYHPREKCVIFGHTPRKDAPYFVQTGDIGIDGGCVFGWNLCAVIIEMEPGPLRLIRVQMNSKDKMK